MTSKFGKYHFAVVLFGFSSPLFMLGAVLDLHLSKFDTPVAMETGGKCLFEMESMSVNVFYRRTT